MPASDGNERIERTLAKALSHRGRLRAAGERVALRPQQIARLEADGYFEAEAKRPAPGKGEAK